LRLRTDMAGALCTPTLCCAVYHAWYMCVARDKRRGRECPAAPRWQTTSTSSPFAEKPGMGKQQQQQQHGAAHMRSHVGDAAAVLAAVDFWTHSAAPEERPREQANGARVSARDERRAAADTQLVEAVQAVLQPGAEVYDGYGVARPSVFVLGGRPKFRAKLAAVMADRGGPGSWMWRPVPKEVLHQGDARQQGGRAAELAAEKRQKEAAKGEAQRLRERKAREMAKLKSVADQFRPHNSGGMAPSDVLDAREAALQAYRLMKSRQAATGVSKRR
jgi:hypothetical protein